MSQTNNSKKIQEFILKNIIKHPNDIVTFSVKTLKISRTTVLRHLNHLIKKNQLLKNGYTKNTYYTIPTNNKISVNLKLSNNLDEFNIIEVYFNKLLSSLPKNIYDISVYGLTEMINNAIDHSYGNNLIIEAIYQNNTLNFTIKDDGIGAFKRIADLLKSSDLREAVLQLNKGKFTSDPYNHTGEGIFFTSRIFDEFKLIANNLCFIRSNYENDWFLEQVNKPTKGTTINLTIAANSLNNIKNLFIKFQDPESLEFNKTEIIVALSKFGNEFYISRSQAKRILRNLEQFKVVTLDFKGVRIVGQGFVDEIFRVFKTNQPQITINYINANEDVLFMIKRSIANN